LYNTLISEALFKEMYMTKLIKSIAIVILSALLLAGCQSSNYKESVEIGAEYPIEMFPIYNNAIVYGYEFNNGVIDITFGSEDDYEKVSKYYELLFEHSKYDVTAQKLTTQSYISSGKTNHYKYLLDVNKSVSRQEKKYYNTIISLRITINDFTIKDEPNIEYNLESTPTPEPVERNTPAPTNTVAPTDTPKPTEEPNGYFDMEVISTVDLVDEGIFIECLGVSEINKDSDQKTVSVLVKIINYGEEETGYISTADFVLIDDLGNAFYSNILDGVFSSGVNILPGGYCIDYVSFVVEDDTIPSVIAMPEGIGNRVNGSYDLELAPLSPPMDANNFDEYIQDIADISHIPTFIIGQEYIVDDVLKIKLNDALYFTNHTTINQENLMYTFSIEFENISSEVIIPVELRDFVLYDIKHNIMIKATMDLTPYNELAFNPVQNGLSENYNISFEIFEETSENYLCLLLSGPNRQDNPIIYKIR